MDGVVNDGQVDESEPHNRPGKVEEVLQGLHNDGSRSSPRNFVGSHRGRSPGSQESLKTQGMLGNSRLLDSRPISLPLCLSPPLVPSSRGSVNPVKLQSLPCLGHRCVVDTYCRGQACARGRDMDINLSLGPQ